MARRASVSAFSLFSFQDIITSVTAILILIMLLLAVELSQKQQAKTAADPGATRRKLVRIAEDLETSVSRLRKAVAAAQFEQSTARPRDQLESELQQVIERLDQARVQRDDAMNTLQIAERARGESEAKLAARDDQREQLAALAVSASRDQAEADRLEEQSAKEKDRQSRRRQEVEKRSKSGTQLVFNRPAASSSRPWLVELSSDGVVAVMLGTNTREVLGDPQPSGRLDAWVARLQPAGDYCLVLTRPSAPATLLDEVEAKLAAAGIDYGIDFIGEDQVVWDGSVDAAAGP